MTYADLNPIRAAMSENIENSSFTSVHQRLDELKALKKGCVVEKNTPRLLPFIESENIHRRQGAIPYNLKHYFELVDYTGRQYRDDKRGQIFSSEPKILDKLGLSAEQWKVLGGCVQFSQISAIHGGNVLQSSIATMGG